MCQNDFTIFSSLNMASLWPEHVLHCGSGLSISLYFEFDFVSVLLPAAVAGGPGLPAPLQAPPLPQLHHTAAAAIQEATGAAGSH